MMWDQFEEIKINGGEKMKGVKDVSGFVGGEGCGCC